MIVIVAIIILAAISVFFVAGFGRFFAGRFPGPRGNFTLDQSEIDEVSGIFENDHRIQCGYYCRNVDPEHEYCSSFRDPRNLGGVY
jgi:hypothetical protein